MSLSIILNQVSMGWQSGQLLGLGVCLLSLCSMAFLRGAWPHVPCDGLALEGLQDPVTLDWISPFFTSVPKVSNNTVFLSFFLIPSNAHNKNTDLVLKYAFKKDCGIFSWFSRLRHTASESFLKEQILKMLF